MQNSTIVYQKQAMFLGYSDAAILCLWVIHHYIYIYIYIYIYTISHDLSSVKGKGKQFTVQQAMKSQMTSRGVAAVFL